LGIKFNTTDIPQNIQYPLKKHQVTLHWQVSFTLLDTLKLTASPHNRMRWMYWIRNLKELYIKH